MWKYIKFGNVLFWVGFIFVFLGLCMINVILDIFFFEGKYKMVGIIFIFIGVICFVVVNYLKKGERYEE